MVIVLPTTCALWRRLRASIGVVEKPPQCRVSVRVCLAAAYPAVSRKPLPCHVRELSGRSPVLFVARGAHHPRHIGPEISGSRSKRGVSRARNRRASREPSERTLSTIPTKERCSCEQWRESRLAPRRRRVHGVDDTSVSDPCGMVFTSRVRIYRPRRYDDGAASSSTDLGREPRREPP